MTHWAPFLSLNTLLYIPILMAKQEGTRGSSDVEDGEIIVRPARMLKMPLLTCQRQHPGNTNCPKRML